MDNLKIAFLGTPEISAHVLKGLVENGLVKTPQSNMNNWEKTN